MTKSNFRGGMQNQFSTEKSDWENTFAVLFNARVRNNIVEPIREPTDITAQIPAGKKQGHYAFDTFHLVFRAGTAWVKQYPSGFWQQVPDFQMSADVDWIYAEAIPGSSVNFQRAGQFAELNFGAPTSPSPSCAICMDGLNQPWIIFPNGTARVTKNWAQWTKEDPEYVPIAKFPMQLGAKLYCMMLDTQGRYTQIVASVSGRPLDFVQLVTNAGEKAGLDEADFGAPALAYAVSYDEGTALRRINSGDNSFLVTTNRTSFLVTQNRDKLIASEPTHTNFPIVPVGAFGPEAIGDLNGDTAVVFAGGIRTFNGVAQSKWEGRNSPLNKAIQNLMTGFVQTTGAVVEYDNYVGFAVNTRYGQGVVWWDSTLEVFVALDIYKGVSAIRQFAVILAPGQQHIFAIDDQDRLFELFTGAASEAMIVLHDIAGAGDDTLAITDVYAAFNLSSAESFWQVMVMADGRLTLSEAVALGLTDAAEDPSARPALPVPSEASSTISHISFLGEKACRSSVILRWRGGAALSRVTLEIDNEKQHQTPKALNETPTIKLAFVGDDGLLNAARSAVNSQIKSIKDLDAVIGLGDHAYNSGTAAEVLANCTAYWDGMHARGKFFAVHGNHDCETAQGEPLFAYLQQTPSRYCKYTFGDHTEVFLFNDGIKTDGSQSDPANQDGASYVLSSQSQMLLNDVRNSTARNKIVIWHHPPTTSSTKYIEIPAVGTAALALVDLAILVADAGATCLISGHGHLYERIVVDNLLRFTAGTGGAELSTIGTPTEGSMRRILEYGYLLGTFTALSAEFAFVDRHGVVRDRYVC